MRIEDVSDHSPNIDPAKLRIGVSACLMGQEVRYDGGHQRDRFLTDTLTYFVEFVTVCPELELGLGVPRETLRLEIDGDATRMVAPASGTDHTESMEEFAKVRVEALAQEDLSGFVFKKSSPSCGLYRVKRYLPKGMSQKDGQGLFAAALTKRFPLLPVEEDGRLNDPILRESFIEKAYAYRRLRTVFSGDWKRRDLVDFHTKEKLLLMAHSPEAYKDLGRLVGEMERYEKDELERTYFTRFMETLNTHASLGRHTNVLQHMAGYFTKHLDKQAREELNAHIQDYRAGIVPILVPLALIRHWVRAFDMTWLAKQSYLEPQPNELMLRTHVSRQPGKRS